MNPERDGHVRVLPIHVANKIAAGEVVERPASVVKELVENAIDAGATNIRIAIAAGGRKLVSVQDDGCGMCRDDALLSLERQATSKIRDVGDIECIDTLGFRGEAVPSIASVSRFTLTTRRRETDEGTQLTVNAGTLADVRTAGCPAGTLVEVRDLFCNVPARRKFLRAYVTEENHVKNVFTVHALAHPDIGFALTVDGRELYRLAPAAKLTDRILDLFGADFLDQLLPLDGASPGASPTVRVTGLIERPNLACPTRRDQYVFVNGRPATAPSIAYALREAYPRHQGDAKPAAFVFITLPPTQVDVNVHPTKREVRFRDNAAVKSAVIAAVESALASLGVPREPAPAPLPAQPQPHVTAPLPAAAPLPTPAPIPAAATAPALAQPFQPAVSPELAPQPVQVEFRIEPETAKSRPWAWFRFLAQTGSGYLLVETDSGLVTVNPHAARERIAFERLLGRDGRQVVSQQLLIPETAKLPPTDAARIRASFPDLEAAGFQIEDFGHDTFKIDAVPQIASALAPADVLATIARDLGETGGKRSNPKWREELIAKSVARSFAGMSLALTPEGATQLVEELAECRMPYVCPRGRRIMIFTSNRELNRKFDLE